jgi:hypothetical protein
MHEITDVVYGDTTVAHDLVGATIERDDTIEDAGKGRGVELKEEFLHGRFTGKSQVPDPAGAEAPALRNS